MICSKCQTNNQEGSKFCGNCGVDLLLEREAQAKKINGWLRYTFNPYFIIGFVLLSIINFDVVKDSHTVGLLILLMTIFVAIGIGLLIKRYSKIKNWFK